MSDYQITNYSRQKAKELNVVIKPSSIKNKKIDVFKNGKKVASIGDTRYQSYPDYLKKDKTLANERRRLYKIRHQHDDKPAGFYADRILW